MSLDLELFPDAKASENLPEQIIGADLTGDLANGKMRQTQFFCGQLAGALHLDALARGCKVCVGTLQGGHMARAGTECAATAFALARSIAQRGTQGVKPGAGVCRQPEVIDTPCFMARRVPGQIAFVVQI